MDLLFDCTYQFMRRFDKKKLPARITLGITPEEKLFLLMTAVLGYPAGQAYSTAFNTKATPESANATASRLIHQRYMQESLRVLLQYYEDNAFAFNDKAIEF